MNLIFLLVVLIFVMLPFAWMPYVLVAYTTVKEKNKLWICCLMALYYGIAAYRFIDPASDPDLVRYIDILRQYEGRTLIESFNLVYSNLFSVDILFYFVAKMKNVQILPAFATFVVYYIIFYVLADYRIRKEISTKNFIVYSVFTCSCIIYAGIVNGIRWPLSYFIFFFALYREMIQEKKNFFTILLYVISVFFHFSTLAFVIMRLALVVKNKKMVIFAGMFTTLIPQLIMTYADKVYGLTSNNIILSSIIYFIWRAKAYFGWSTDEEGWAKQVKNSGYFTFENAFYWIVAIFFIFIIYKMAKRNEKFFNKINIFIFYTLMVTIVSFFMAGHVYIRFVTPLVFMFAIIYFQFIKLYETNSIVKVTNICLIGFSLIGTFANLYYLGMMMKLGDYFSDVFSYGLLRYCLENLFVGFK